MMDKTTICTLSFAVSFAAVFQYSIPLAVFAGMAAFLIAWKALNLAEYYRALKWHSRRKEDIYVYAEKPGKGINKEIKARAEWHEKMLAKVNRLGEDPDRDGRQRDSMAVKVIPVYFQDYMAPREAWEEYLERARKTEHEGHYKRNVKLNGTTGESREWYINQVLSER